MATRSQDKPRDQIQRFREAIIDYADKVCRVRYDHPPSTDVCAQLIEACDDDNRKLSWLLTEIYSSKMATSHYSPMWWVTIALQRVHGIPPKTTAARREQLNASRKLRADGAAIEDMPAGEFFEEIARGVRKAVAGKRIG